MYYRLYYDLNSGERFILTDDTIYSVTSKVFDFDGTQSEVSLNMGVDTTRVIIKLIDANGNTYIPSSIKLFNSIVVIEHSTNLTGKAVITFL